nr:HipA N-terminal domain-containing protein [Prosthecochloris ethylica]
MLLSYRHSGCWTILPGLLILHMIVLANSYFLQHCPSGSVLPARNPEENMPDVDVFLDWQGSCRLIGRMYRQSGRGRETVTFEYDKSWIEAPDHFSIDASLKVGRGMFTPLPGQVMFGTIGDSAPDQWGRRLMRRAERRRAEHDKRTPRTLSETDFLLGVADETRLGGGERRPETGDRSAFGAEISDQ